MTFEGESEEEVSRVRSDMEELNPVRFDSKPTENAWEKVQQFLSNTADPHMTEVVEGSLKVVEECFGRCSHPLVFMCLCSVCMCCIRFPPESVSVCYNGGKDCIVMLHLVHAYFQVLLLLH